jgi:hypothetical protein
MKRVKSWISGGSVVLVQLLAVCILFVGLPEPKAEAAFTNDLLYFQTPDCSGPSMPMMDAWHAVEHGAQSALDTNGTCSDIEREPWWYRAGCIAGPGLGVGIAVGAATAAVGALIAIPAGGVTVAMAVKAGALTGGAGALVTVGATLVGSFMGIDCRVRIT